MNRRAFLAVSGAAAIAPAATAPVAHAQGGGRFAAARQFSADHDGVGFLVCRHGVILAEDYAADSAPDTRWEIGAGARLFAPLLIATLVEDRLMQLDEPVSFTFPTWSAHPLKNLITVRTLISGASGIAFGEGRTGSINEAINLEPVAEPGQRLIEDEAPYMLLAEIARMKLEAGRRGSDPAIYLTERVLAPIGCTPIGWTRDAGGAPRLDTGVLVSTRGWGLVGEFFRREGVWRGQELADANTLREARRGAFLDQRFGLGLWLANGERSVNNVSVDSDLWRMSPPAPYDLAMAAGEGGQRLYVIPSENLVIVRQSRSLGARDWSDATFLALVSGAL